MCAAAVQHNLREVVAIVIEQAAGVPSPHTTPTKLTI